MQFGLLKLPIYALILANVAFGSHWSYTDPKTEPLKWPELYKAMCSGTWQSPIDLNTETAVLLPQKKTISIYYDEKASNSSDYTLKNNGHSIQVSFPTDYWFVSFDGDKSFECSVIQLHFHWGGNDSRGSEHRINSRSFPLEGHLVCYRKSMYPNASTAAKSPGGLAVLAFLYTVEKHVPKGLTQLDQLGSAFEILNQTIEVGSSHNIGYIDLTQLIRHVDPSSYFRYSGSLTTPPCTENVAWTVFTTSVTVTEDQLNLLRKQTFPSTENQTYMYDNYRPVQPLNGPKSLVLRVVYRSSAVKISSTLLVALQVLVSIIEISGL